MGKLNGEKSYFSQVYVDPSHCRSGPRSLVSSLGIESHSLKKKSHSAPPSERLGDTFTKGKQMRCF